MHADVDERAERGHVGDHALQHHPRRQVADLLDPLHEGGGPELRARVAAGLLQLGEDVGDGGQAERVVDELGRPQPAQDGRLPDQRAQVLPGVGEDPPHHRVRLGVHAGGVERVVAAGDAQEAGALLERLRPEPGHLLQLGPGAERPVGVTVQHDVLGQPGADAGDPGEQRGRGGVDVDADGVDAVLHHRVEGAGQLHLGQVVLVLPDADRARIDLHELGQRVLEAAGDGDRAAQRDVQPGQLLGGVRGGGVDRRAGLGDHHLGQLQLGVPLDQVTGELVGLPAGRAVADGDQLDAVRRGQGGQRVHGGVPLPARLVRVDRVGGDDLAGGVDHGHLHAGAQSRVEAHGGAGAGRRGQQQVAQVGGEDPHGLLLGRLPEPHPQVGAEVDEDPGTPGPAHRVGEPPVGGPPLVADAEPAGDGRLVAGGTGDHGVGVAVGLRVHRQVEHALLLASEHGEDPVRGKPGVRLGEVEVVGELGAAALLTLAYPGDQPAPRPHLLAQRADEVGVLGEALDEDGPGAVERGGDVGHPLVGVDVTGGRVPGVPRRVGQQRVRQGLQPRLAGDLGPGPPLGLVGQVDVLQPRLRVGRHDLRFQGLVELALAADGLQHRGASLVQLAEVAQPLLQGAQLRVVEQAGGLLAVAGDERHGGAAVEQLHGRPHLTFGDAEFLGDSLVHRLGHDLIRLLRWVPPCIVPAGSDRLCRTRRSLR
ncbi:hypothetical protein B0E53_06285 [Micromonospora sp. MH33]|nr:hypothetical protein B0E53_06285 [Micromonospora sp. MH33]